MSDELPNLENLPNPPRRVEFEVTPTEAPQPQNLPLARNRGGRPRKVIDPELVRKLAEANLATAEIAAILDCSPDTIERRFSGMLKKGRMVGTGSAKRELYVTAMGNSKGKIAALIFFLKAHAGLSDRLTVQQVPDLEEWATPTKAKDVIAQLSSVDRNFLRSVVEKVARISQLSTHECLQRVLTTSEPDV